jgi:hypothetical protein
MDTTWVTIVTNRTPTRVSSRAGRVLHSENVDVKWNESMRKLVGKLLIGGLLACVLAAVLTYRYVDNTLRNCYAQWSVADIVIIHLNANQQRWPRSREDLIDDYNVLVSRSRCGWTIQELSRRVDIDWNADPSVLRNISPRDDRLPQFRVIWARDGSPASFQNHDPNKMIAEYLATHPPIQDAAEQPVPPEKPVGR